MKKNMITSGAIISLLCLAETAMALPSIVQGTSDIWLAGTGLSAKASVNPSNTNSYDTNPGETPVPVTDPLTAGETISLNYIGAVLHLPGTLPSYGPDGDLVNITVHVAGIENGISDIKAPLNSLIGVFLGAGAAPTALDFETQAQRDYLNLLPELNQVFFIGDGYTSLNVLQTITVPTGVTGFYLGTMDGYEWNNNIGSYTLAAVPEPATMLLFGVGLAGVAGFQSRRKKG